MFFELDVEQKKEFYGREQTKKLLSEGLGLESNHLKDMGCPDTVGFVLHYYPPCPQPELAIACVHHTDIDFLIVIVQDEVGGLQVLHHNSWIDVPYIPGALVVNIGDMLQSQSPKSRARVSNATFFGHGSTKSTRLYGPIKELVSEKNPPKYKEITIGDFYRASYEKGVDGTSVLPRLKLDNYSSASSV
ncbi:1-aminocyclopropane-1-carboxylate oxidase homolog 12 [Linum perenne]